MLNELSSANFLLKAAILVGSVLTAVVLPVVITLLWRLHDDRSKLLETDSAKAVWEQVVALRHLQDWRTEQLHAEISASDERLRKVLQICKAHPYDTQRQLVEQSKKQDTELWFYLASEDDRRFMSQDKSLIGVSARGDNDPGCWN